MGVCITKDTCADEKRFEDALIEASEVKEIIPLAEPGSSPAQATLPARVM